WAFIPHNLLYKLRRMRIKDPDCGYYLNHEFFVDGTPAIADVYFNGAWRTVLVCGQGPGWGKNQKCYYFALDVTNPLDPKPLWEFTDYYMGETWSVPKIARIKSPDKWVVFFGSGYDNDYNPKVAIGHYFYVVDVATGELLKSFKVGKDLEVSKYGIQNTLPGSPETIDKNKDGYDDAVYFGDLLGRIWKIDLSLNYTNWEVKKIYEDPFNFPIFTKPAVIYSALDQTVRLYFGTGGDDKAPNSSIYSFVALADTDQGAIVEWYLGSEDFGKSLKLTPEKQKGTFVIGEKVWADPVIIERTIYIATLEGSIESINPCKSTVGKGKIYARYTLGNQMGGSALMSSQGDAINFMETLQKVRSAVTVGSIKDIRSQSGQPPMNFREVFIQSFTQPTPGSEPPYPPSQVLAQPISPNVLVIKEWREIYKIQRIK
ncbi:MAG: PilC/PilY family type IV pilus protein, partial [Candidatus Aminicenantes bacterium]|nr:PilC/PilY family type IV pilus protein [Candidatus Aminicenantes bacterium]